MIELLVGVQKVELVGGEGWLSRNAGSAVLAIAAVLAAGLAAYVAIRNQREQLAHDRYLRNRDHTRDTIDAAVIAANDLRDVMDHFSSSITSTEERRSYDAQPLQSDLKERLDAERKDALSKLQAMRAAHTRLEIRLEKTETIVVEYRAALEAFAFLFKAVHRGSGANRATAMREGANEREKEAKVALARFQDACRNWLNEEAGSEPNWPGAATGLI